jgi:proteasome lid subunit RPN8/RPN11
MLQAVVNEASRLLNELNWFLHRQRIPVAERGEVSPAARQYHRLQRVVLTDGVGRSLFEEYAAHRETARGEEETGWVMLGVRESEEAVVLATLPAGAERSAGVAHIRFNSSAQAIASRIIRQLDRRLTMLGVVHTHPGSLRHPSDGDYRGDSLWVGQLRGGEGIFGIGTADASPVNGTLVAIQPKPHMQCMGKLCLSWYALKEGDRHYKPLPVAWTLGPDLANPLRPVWPTLELHAERLDRLARQQAGVRFEVMPGKAGEALAVIIPLAEPGDAIRVLLEGKEITYFLVRAGEVLAVDPQQSAQVDQGVYLLLAELAAQE